MHLIKRKVRLTPALAAVILYLSLASLQAQSPGPVDAGTPASAVLKTNFNVQLTIQSGEQSGSVTAYTVPDGKRLVVEFVSSFISLGMGDRVTSASVNNAAVAPAYVYDSGFNSFTTISQSVRYYVNAGESLVFTVGRSYTTGPVTFPVTLTGYVEDAP